MLLSSFSENLLEAGCDEAGRGCLAGPVVAAAVILPTDYSHQLLNDSKKLSEKQRILLKADIINDALAWAVTFVDNNEIDQVNILNASFIAMNRSVEKLEIQPELLLVDGNRYKPHNDIPFECVIKGDGKYLSIAAASILAKTFRDEYMEELSMEFPQYQWQKNKGYPTKAHRLAIAEIGLTDYHRKSFRQLPDQLTLFD